MSEFYCIAYDIQVTTRKLQGFVEEIPYTYVAGDEPVYLTLNFGQSCLKTGLKIDSKYLFVWFGHSMKFPVLTGSHATWQVHITLR